MKLKNTIALCFVLLMTNGCKHNDTKVTASKSEQMTLPNSTSNTSDDKDSSSSEPGGQIISEKSDKSLGSENASMDLAMTENDFDKLPPRPLDGAEDSSEVRPDGASLSSSTIILDKQGRDGNRYVLMSNGDFFRYIYKQGNLKCQITSAVQDFKISMHPNDAALVYFIRRESSADNLYVLNHQSSGSGSTCPKTVSTMILPRIKVINGKYKYTVVSNTNPQISTKVVNMALSTRNGSAYDQLVAWDNNYKVYSQTGVKDYIMNECWAVETKTFNNYVAFNLTNNNELWKVSGIDPIRETKKDTKSWTSFSDFKYFYKVCEPIVTNPPQPPHSNITADFYRSDSCSSGLIGSVSFTSDTTTNESACQSFANKTTQTVWGVKINGICYDIYDQSPLESCRHSQANPKATTTVTMYRSDSCNSSIIGFFSYDSVSDLEKYCNIMAKSSSPSVWGIRPGTQSCLDTYDSSLASACRMFRYAATTAPAGSRSVDFYRSDYCNGAYLGRVVLGTNTTQNSAICRSISPYVSTNVWGIKKNNGSCQNIPDTSYENACKSN